MKIFLFIIIFFFQFLNLKAKSNLPDSEFNIYDNLKSAREECKNLQGVNSIRCEIKINLSNYNFYKDIYDNRKFNCANHDYEGCLKTYNEILFKIYQDNFLLFRIRKNENEAKQAILFLERALELANKHDKLEELFYEKVYYSAQLGWYYSSIPSVVNYEKSFKLLEFASSENNYNAMNNLAYGFYEQGKLGKKNLEKALKLYKISSASGNHWANENIAQFYMFGLANETKSYEKTISHFKLARIEDDGTDNFIDLQILFQKKKLPKNEKEYYSWLIETLYNKLNKDKFSKIHITEIVHIAHFSQTRLENFKLAYKWFHICQKYFKDEDISYGSESEVQKCEWEMAELERDRLGNKDINKIKQEAEDFWKKNIPIIN